MNWLTKFVRPKIRALVQKKDMPDNLWIKCPSCGQMLHHKEAKDALFVCPHCDHHRRIGAQDRFEQIFDDGRFTDVELPDTLIDPLKFRDEKRYTERLKDSRNRSGQKDAIEVAHGTLDGINIVAAVQNFEFMGGSLGMAAGDALLTAAKLAVHQNAPLLMFTAAGGARMQEGILSLMQLPRSTIAVDMLRENALPYIVILTDPTTGGVTASYAMLGDIAIAEPGALIGFAGRRVIENTIRERLPEGFQRSEYLLEHGMLDMVVHRNQLRETLARVLDLMLHAGPSEADAVPAPATLSETPAATGDDALAIPEPAPSGSKAGDGTGAETKIHPEDAPDDPASSAR